MISLRRLAPFLLLILPALVYANTLANAYQLDDQYRIVENRELDRVWPPWRHFVDKSTSSTLPTLVLYRPLLPLSLSVNHWLSDRLGIDRRTGLHVGNIAIHLLSTLLLYLLFRELIAGFEPANPHKAQASFFAALIFSVHPVAGVPVNYLSKRDVLLAQLFLTAAMLLYVRMRAGPRASPVTAAACAGLFALALLSRQEAVAGVLVILCFEQLRPGASPGHRLRGPALIAVALLAAGWVLWRESWILKKFSFEYALIQLKAHLWIYLADAVWPLRVRPLPDVRPVESPLDPAMLSGLALVLATLYLAWRLKDRRPLASLCIAAYWLLLAPTSSLIALTELATPYRLYPSLAFLSLLAVLAAFSFASARKATFALAYAALFLGLAGYAHNKSWRDERSLWARNVRYGGTATAHLNYGRSLAELYPARAEKHFRHALEREPDNIFALINLGRLQVRAGRIEEGLAHLETAARTRPDLALPHHWLAIAYRHLDRPEEAQVESRRAADLEPRNAAYQYRAVKDLLDAGDAESALVYLRRLQRRSPDFRDAGLLEASALHALGRWQRAESSYRRFLESRPDHAEARLALATGLAARGRCEEAIGEAEQALRADARIAPSAHRLLAECHTAAGNVEAASRHAALAGSGSESMP